MYHVIVNPASRSGKGQLLWDQSIRPLLDRSRAEYRVYFSQKKGDLTGIAAGITAASEEDPLYLILLGGDGSVNEVLQGIADPGRVILGYIPTGSSNDLARDLKLPTDPKRALERILAAGTIHTMDMGLLTFPDGRTHRFAGSSGIGFDAAVCEEVSRSGAKGFLNRLGLGKLVYLAVALRQLFTAGDTVCELIPDGGSPVRISRFLFAAALIHRYEGGGFKFCPDAADDDGVLNLCAVGSIPRLLILFALPTAFFGKHYLFKGVDAYTAKRVTLTSSAPLWVHTDGEALGQYSSFTAECVKGALRIIL